MQKIEDNLETPLLINRQWRAYVTFMLPVQRPEELCRAIGNLGLTALVLKLNVQDSVRAGYITSSSAVGAGNKLVTPNLFSYSIDN